MLLRRTFNATAVNRLLKEYYEDITDDTALPKAQFNVTEQVLDVRNYFLALTHHRKLVGCWVFYACGNRVYDSHICLEPSIRGKVAHEWQRKVWKYMFEVANAKLLVATVPTTRPDVKRYALRSGMKVTGRVGGWWKNGVDVGLHVMKLSANRWEKEK